MSKVIFLPVETVEHNLLSLFDYYHLFYNTLLLIISNRYLNNYLVDQHSAVHSKSLLFLTSPLDNHYSDLSTQQQLLPSLQLLTN